MRYTENYRLVLYDISDKWSNECWNNNYTIIDRYIKSLCDKTEKLNTKTAEFTESVTSPHFIGNADTASKWKTPISVKIGNYTTSLDGSTNLLFTLEQIGASAIGHTHPYLPLAGGTMDTDAILVFNGDRSPNAGIVVQNGQSVTSIESDRVDTSQIFTTNVNIRQAADTNATIPSGIFGSSGNNDFWRVVGCAHDNDNSSGSGYLEIASADDGNEPIYVRQYYGVYTTLARTLTLLDNNGNTVFPGTLLMANGGQVATNGDSYLNNANGLTGWVSALINSKSPSNHTHNYAGSSSVGGSANSAVKLHTARTINGTSFNGTSNITTANWGTTRAIKIGNTSKNVNGSGNVTWTLAEIGAAASSHTHGNYLSTTGGSIGNITIYNQSSGTGSEIILNPNISYPQDNRICLRNERGIFKIFGLSSPDGVSIPNNSLAIHIKPYVPAITLNGYKIEGPIIPYNTEDALGASATRWRCLYTKYLDVANVTTFGSQVRPALDNVSALGGASTRWSTIYGVNMRAETMYTNTLSSANSRISCLKHFDPSNSATYSLGSSSKMWNSLYTGNIYMNNWLNLDLGGNTRMRNASGNLEIRTKSILPATSSIDIGSSISQFRSVIAQYGNFSASVTNAVWNDYAEYYERGEKTEPGDIVMLDPDSDEERYILATEDSDLIVGVHSDSYGYIVGGEHPTEDFIKLHGNEDKNYFKEYNDPNFIPIGLAGRVKVKVVGSIKKGDLIVVSKIPGVGRRYEKERDSKFNVIGFAVETNLDTSIKRVKMQIRK